MVLELLFSSSARVKILTLFLLNPESRFYQREIEGLTGLPIRAVQREVKRLETLGLLQRTVDGNRVYYQVDREFFLFPELKIMILKTTGLGSLLREKLRNEDRIKIAFIYGSYAADQETTSSDIDLFVIGGLSSKELHAAVKEAEKVAHREINYTLFSLEEFCRKARARNGFLLNVFGGQKIFLKGDEVALQSLAARGEDS
ncbi:MAG: nucleotidyltransferase domain-containing protein [Anaerolineales bacterium]|nr:nucleotidyltransferase domain-containing protein [Anaerolineales bacterium]